MKRHKRDRTSRAWQRGYQAGLVGRSRELCPHGQLTARSSWLDGWHEGHRDLEDGTIPLSGLHKRAR